MSRKVLRDPGGMRCRGAAVSGLAVMLGVIVLLAAGCGGRGPSGVASVPSATPAATTPARNAQASLVAFSRCMRADGAPNFPDPQLGGRHDSLTITPAVFNAPQFGAAKRACNHLLPTGGLSQETARQRLTQLLDWLSFARCMRNHGAPRFPDPTAQGQVTVEMVEAQGIDVHSPVFLQGTQSCLPASHGLLTPAAVANAFKNTGR